MSNKAQNNKIIFGLKMRSRRTERNLSFAELSKQTGMAVSYLNEIEKGKKFPKADKISLLAAALETTSAELTSEEMPKSFAPVADLLQSNFLNELPLDLFGIEMSKVVEIIANAPMRVGAFVSTLVELGRNYALREENFYFAALRSYLELHNNYFEDLEEAVRQFVRQHRVPTGHALPVSYLVGLLGKKYEIEVIENGLAAYPDLQTIRSVYLPKRRKLLLNGQLNDAQKAFQLGKELGFNALHLTERSNTGSLLRVKTFEEALNHYKAGYFSAALLMHRDVFVKDVEQFLKREKWDGLFLIHLLEKYQASPELLCQRLTGVLPQFFDLKKIFFLRFVEDLTTGKIEINKELHLDRKHQPHGNGLDEHYCRRWVSVTLLDDLKRGVQTEKGDFLVGVQKSHYHKTNDEYLCFSIARKVGDAKHVSVTIGILMDAAAAAKIRFLNDPALSRREVSTTCERCAVVGCLERAVPPSVVLRREQRNRVSEALKKLLE
jgi:XRE family transcriptional regulator, fatty acid utilization regulator